MAKDGRFLPTSFSCLLLAFPIVFTPAAVGAAPPGDAEPDQAIAATLAVQIALERGRDCMLNAKYKEAVETLEAQLPRINGNRAYLQTLRDAYRAYIQELRAAHKDGEAQTYQKRLEILDPPPKTDTPKAKINSVKPAPDTSAKPDRVVRAEKDDDAAKVDPFKQITGDIDAHSKLIEQAEREYAAQRYDVALEIFEKAAGMGFDAPLSPLDPPPKREYGERWAYCILYKVMQQVKEAPANAPLAAELEAEVKRAMKLAGDNPRILDFGSTLLARIDERRSGKAAAQEVSKEGVVRHLGKSKEGWQISETANFRILHNQPTETIEEVARVAEKTRADMQRRWLGEVSESWRPACDIYLYSTAQEYSKATGESENSPGHSTTFWDGARVTGRAVHLHCDHAGMTTTSLPHEVTHVVLAGQCGDKPLPRWADEGIAVLSESGDRVDRYVARLTEYSQRRQLFTVRGLMQTEEWPDPRQINAFYAQSVSVVDFLTRAKGPQTFTRFLRESQKIGYEKALQKHYGFKDFTELEQEWRKVALSDKAKAGAGVAERKPNGQ
jgi:tetratricopeptide (TPR) repeat protein